MDQKKHPIIVSRHKEVEELTDLLLRTDARRFRIAAVFIRSLNEDLIAQTKSREEIAIEAPKETAVSARLEAHISQAGSPGL